MSGIISSYDAKDTLAYEKGAQAHAENDLSRLFVLRQMNLMENKNVTVADIGCGTGIDLKALQKRGFTNLIGVEPGESMRRQARAFLGNAAVILKGQFEKIPLKDGTIDVVISRYVAQACPDLKLIFMEAARVIKPSGKLIVITSHPAANENSPRNSDGTVTASLYGGTVKPVCFPHSVDDYAEALRGHFLIQSKLEYHTNERDDVPAHVYSGLCFSARAQKYRV